MTSSKCIALSKSKVLHVHFGIHDMLPLASYAMISRIRCTSDEYALATNWTYSNPPLRSVTQHQFPILER